MPLQKWMTEHGHPGWYSWLVVIGGALTSALMAVTISITVNARTFERERAQQRSALERERVQNEQARLATCLVIRRMVDVYADPSTETGQKAATAWEDLGRIFQCKEI
jgi:hypothetical protein